MSKLNSRQQRFPGDPRGALKGFYLPQRKQKTLKASAKPQFGVSQPMPKKA